VDHFLNQDKTLSGRQEEMCRLSRMREDQNRIWLLAYGRSLSHELDNEPIVRNDLFLGIHQADTLLVSGDALRLADTHSKV